MTRVLIVDDDPLSLDIVRRLLDPARYTVETAADGVEALRIMRDPDRFCRIVISDWIMPNMDGLALCRALRSHDFSSYVYFLLLTHRERPDDVVTGFEAGADDYICKPFEPQELRSRVEVGRRIIALESRDLVLFAMARLAESRDPETGDHLDRMRHYCLLLAKHLCHSGPYTAGLDRFAAQQIYLTSPLHDIGKIGIPDGILLKPGALTAEEYEVMKTHTTIGAATLNGVIDRYPDVPYLRLARDIALYHHEKYNGTGYPTGLRGDDIPLAARIVSLADVYDALRSRRVYKAERSHEESRAVIVAESGRHFDPAVVEAFLAVEEQFRAISELYAPKVE